MRLAEDASSVLNTELVAAVLLEPDDTAEWSLLVDELAEIQSEQGLTGVENVYLLASVQGVLRVLADPTGDDAALAVADTVLVDVKRAVLRTRQPGYSPEAYSDEYGTWMSGYVPLSNGGEDLPVLLAVDLPLGALPVMEDIVWGALLRSLVPALVLSLIVAVLLSRRLTRCRAARCRQQPHPYCPYRSAIIHPVATIVRTASCSDESRTVSKRGFPVNPNV